MKETSSRKVSFPLNEPPSDDLFLTHLYPYTAYTILARRLLPQSSWRFQKILTFLNLYHSSERLLVMPPFVAPMREPTLFFPLARTYSPWASNPSTPHPNSRRSKESPSTTSRKYPPLLRFASDGAASVDVHLKDFPAIYAKGNWMRRKNYHLVAGGLVSPISFITAAPTTSQGYSGGEREFRMILD